MANKIRFTEAHEIEELEAVIKMVISGALSYRNGAQRLITKTGKKFSHEGLRKIINKRKQDDRDSEVGLGDQSPELPEE